MTLKAAAASMCLAALTNVTPPAFDGGGYLYEATRDFTLTPVATQEEDKVTANARGDALKLDKGDVLILEGTKVDERGESLTRFALDDVDEKTPSTYWIRTRDLNDADLKLTVRTSAQLFTPVQTPAAAPEQEFVETHEARRHWGFARRARRANYCTSHPTAPRCCKSAVNYQLIRMGLLATRVNGLPASSMAGGLASRGWREVGCGARSRPTRGMTCTYRGGGSGHTEAWNGRCWYYGARCTPEAMSQSNRQCFSCKVPGGR